MLGGRKIPSTDAEEAVRPEDYTIRLKSRKFTPQADIQMGLSALQDASGEGKHMLIQFERIPTQQERSALEAAGVELLDYVPHKTWFASVSKVCRGSRVIRPEKQGGQGVPQAGIRAI